MLRRFVKPSADMRTPCCLIIATLLSLATAARANTPRATTVRATTPRATDDRGRLALATALRIHVDKSKVDLKHHRLEVTLSHQAAKISIKVMGESGETLAEEEHDFTGRAAGTPLVVTWTPSRDEPIARIDVRATDSRGFFVGVALSPWFVAIPHDEVNFRTGSSEIDEPERPKLDAAYARLEAKLGELRAKDKDKQHRNITLFIAGHTDTVAADGYNLKLSQGRARSIAAWFRRRGVRIPIAYEGFGETSLAVKTADQVDEPRNRRADYFLSDDDPPLKTTGFRPVWKRVN